ncbi:hypothetical protein [Alteromonas australica]|uniref:hypothetical protein n=1 Tax=Alteromonas australica TaxID=589873 RepID=UPI002490FD9E|nr:hypothetical protein [Alteromonas australica]|tara:strand:- start:848 stop:1126 length:279 start_codon:yes stop_codon:yes gene_type:complete
MIVARPKHSNEPCLIKGNAFADLYLYDLSGQLVVRQNAPESGWNYDALEMIAEDIVSSNDPLGTGEQNTLQHGWDAYLGDKSQNNWIGSSEV